MTPFVTVGHRYGHVFLRFVRKTKLGRVDTVARLEADEALRIAKELTECATAIVKRRTRRPKLRIAQ